MPGRPPAGPPAPVLAAPPRGLPPGRAHAQAPPPLHRLVSQQPGQAQDLRGGRGEADEAPGGGLHGARHPPELVQAAGEGPGAGGEAAGHPPCQLLLAPPGLHLHLQ